MYYFKFPVINHCITVLLKLLARLKLSHIQFKSFLKKSYPLNPKIFVCNIINTRKHYLKSYIFQLSPL